MNTAPPVWLLAWLLVAWGPRVLGEPTTAVPLRAFVAVYELSRDGLPVGETRVELQLLPDGGYVYHARTEPGAPLSLFREDLIREESRGSVVDGRPRPDRYSYHRTGSGVDRSVELEFDWPRSRVRVRESGSHWYLPIPPGTLDKLLQQLVFTRDLAAGARNLRYPVADGGRLKHYSYRVLGREPVVTPLGHFDTVKVERKKDGGASDYTLWVAPALDHQPVRILRRLGSSSYQMDLAELHH